MWLNKCCASTADVEAATHKSKRESDDSVVAILKKQNKEINEITNSLKEMSEVIKTLRDNSLTKADLEDILLKQKETTNKMVEETPNKMVEETPNKVVEETPNKVVEPIFECCFDTGGALGNNLDTIFVSGFDCSFPRDVIKSTLFKHFVSCGKMYRVFVPIECHTGSPLGFAFINFTKGRSAAEKALLLHHSELGGLKLEVVMASDRDEYYGYSNFKGCDTCRMARLRRPIDNYEESCGVQPSADCMQPRLFEVDCPSDIDDSTDEEAGVDSMANKQGMRPKIIDYFVESRYFF